MNSENKTKKQVVNKLKEFHQRINELERGGIERKRLLEQEFKLEMLRIQIEKLIRKSSVERRLIGIGDVRYRERKPSTQQVTTTPTIYIKKPIAL